MSDPEVTTFVCPVDEVTLLEDRARVRRRGTVTLPAGTTRLRVAGVSPLLVDKTLLARVEAGEATVHDARVARRTRHRPEERQEAVRLLDVEIEETGDAERRMDRRLHRIEQALALLESAGTHTVEELEEDAAWSRSDPAGWEKRLAGVTARERDLREERLGAARELRDRRRELARLRALRAQTLRPSDEVEASIEVDVELEEEAEITLEVDYLVANACWRPYHRATLDGGAVRFESEGCVWQRTGEDWDDVRLRFSTQRPSLGAEPPRLSTDQLRVQRKSEVLHVEARQQVIETTGLGAGAQVTPELPGIDDGGEAMELRATHRATVPSDGRPHRVPLFAFDSEAEATLRCAPELVPAILLETMLTNRSTNPVLAGPVDLVKGGGPVGRTSTLYIAPSERFRLGWGPDPALRVHRDVDSLDPESNLMRTWHTTTTTVTLKVSNLGPEPKTIELVERVPVSELEKVQIEVDSDATTDGARPDDDGFLRWTLTLDAFGRREVTLTSALRRHSDVVGL